jgi:sugar transferase (PEP-CTERM/EpsH1 system associated)
VKITHFVENLNRGGLERVVLDLIRAQHADGHDCQVICLFERGALADELADIDVPVHACGKKSGIDLAAVARARTLLRCNRPAVLHTHNVVSHYHAVLAALGLPIARVVNTRHGMGALRPGGRRDRLYRYSMRFTHVVVTVCEAAKDDLIASGIVPAGKIVSVPNGIDVDGFRPATAATRQRLAVELGFPADTRLIGSVGRLNWAKDQATLIRMFGKVVARVPRAALVLVGDGALSGELVALAEAEGIDDRVRFLGDRDDIPALLQGFTLFTSSSITEGYSIAMMEACAAALPVIATRVGGNAEIVREGINGRLVEAGDADALADTVAMLLDDESRAQAMGRAGREWVVQHGSLRAMAARYAQVYAGVTR